MQLRVAPQEQGSCSIGDRLEAHGAVGEPFSLPGLIVHSHRGAEPWTHAQAAAQGAGVKPGLRQPAL